MRVPDHSDKKIGREAWAQAWVLSSEHGCPSCPMTLGANLECQACRDFISERQKDGKWPREELIQRIADAGWSWAWAHEAVRAAERALHKIYDLCTVEYLSEKFFCMWALAFTYECGRASCPISDKDIVGIRAWIECMMVQPGFSLPEKEKVS